MKKEKKINKTMMLILLCCLTMILTSCKNETEPKHNYQIIENKYYNQFTMDGSNIYNGFAKGFSIYYPQIENLGDEELELEMNNKIKECAMKEIRNSSPKDGVITTTYSVTLDNERFISIHFEANSFEEHQLYPLISSKTITIDLKTGKALKLSDIIDVDDSFKREFFNLFTNTKNYNFKEISDKSLFYEHIEEYVYDSVNLHEKLIKSDQDNYPEVHSYITEDSLVISFAVPKVIGSYALYEAKYKDLKKWLKSDFITSLESN